MTSHSVDQLATELRETEECWFKSTLQVDCGVLAFRELPLQLEDCEFEPRP